MSLKPVSFRHLVSTQRCAADVVELFDQRGLSHHLFADDKQLLYTGALELGGCRHRLSSCVRDLHEWCASRRLQLNASKTELVWFGSRASLTRLKPEDRVLKIGATVVKLCATSASCLILS